MQHRITILLLLVFVTPMACKTPDKSPSTTATLASFLKPDKATPESIILITLDTWRHDAAGFSGNPNAKTPTIDQLANGGIHFENAYAHATLTLPSHASLLTGLLPHHHGLRDNAGFRLSPEIPTLAGLLSKQGFKTGAFISAFPLDSRYGLNHDFDHYDDLIDRYAAPLAKVTERPGEDTIDQALNWMAQHEGEKTFTWIHLYEPHYPYLPPEPFRSRFERNPYLGEVAYSDHLLKKLLDPYLKGDKQATIILTSDHGEGLGDHGEATHGLFAYDATLKVPLVLWSPTLLEPGKVSQRVGQVDMVPTLLELHGVSTRQKLDGRSLVSQAPTPKIYFESLSTYLNRGWAPLRGCIENHQKAIQLPIPELYDLEADPQESNNLAASQQSQYKTCLTCLPSDRVQIDQRMQLSDEEREKLASLGYAAASSGPPKLTGLASDPKNLIEVDDQIYEAFGLAEKGQFKQASLQLENIIENNPEVELAYQYASDFAYQAGELLQAIKILDLAFQRGVASEISQRKLALYLIESGNLEPAANILAPWSQSKDPETHSARGKLLTNQGQFNAAQAAFDQALALDSSNPSVWAEIGTMHLISRDPIRAKQAFEKALSQNDRNADALNGMGVILAQSGQIEAAKQAWEKALSVNPRMAFCHRNLANIYQRQGDFAKVRTHLQAFADLVQGEPKARALERLKNLPQ